MRFLALLSLTLTLVTLSSEAQTVRVSGTVQISGKKAIAKDASNVVLWLTPRNGAPPPMPPKQYRLVQHDKHFEPHLLIVPVGGVVEFPNRDPFFHNVFSVYEGTPFDLGLYESGTSRPVHFNRPGPSYIFCNIHPEMSAVVLALKTPYYAITNSKGEFAIEAPEGEYELGVWYERTLPDDLKGLAKRISISGVPTDLGVIKLAEAPSIAEGHKNKYGQTYEGDPNYPLH
jgi:plastocyanin